ncbi:polyketide synthase dehydratase domain-containing protein, partial [Streptomyces sp. DT24]
MLADFEKVVSGLSFSVPVLPVVSGLSGEVSDEVASPGYWVRHVREAVRFADAVTYTAARGVTTFIEIGPDAVLAGMAAQSVEGGLFVPVQRRSRSEAQTAVGALGRLHTAGVRVDWAGFYGGSGARRVGLPTYAFQRERFWLGSVSGGDVVGVGQVVVEHPVLGAVVVLADSGGVVLTGRLSVDGLPWLVDHGVLGSVLLPGAAFVELAVRAGDEVGCGLVEELTLRAPLVLSGSGGVAVQVVVGGVGEGGRRSLRVYSRREGAGVGEAWVLHAEGVLAEAGPVPEMDLTEWPPPGATDVFVDNAYELLHQQGYEYGPVFRGLKAAWRRGDDVFAEVVLPESAHADAERFGVHPALLDATMHALGVGEHVTGEEATELPFSWTNVSLHANGARALRVHLSRQGPNSLSLKLADENGSPVATIGGLSFRPVSVGQLSAGGSGGLWEVVWRPVSGAGAAVPGGSGAVVFDVVAECGGGLSGSDVVSGVRLVTGRVLGVVQEWLSGAGGGGGPLVVVTRGAVAVGEGEGVDVCQAPVWGLVRAAQAENP